MINDPNPTPADLSPFREAMHRLQSRADEAGVLTCSARRPPMSADARKAATPLQARWHGWTGCAPTRAWPDGVFLAEYGLSTDEGLALVCLAEALLRVPDAEPPTR